jgi:hypothetical protein
MTPREPQGCTTIAISRSLANTDMMAWSRYLRDEAMQTGCEILDTGAIPFEDYHDRILQLLAR